MLANFLETEMTEQTNKISFDEDEVIKKIESGIDLSKFELSILVNE